MARTSFGLAIPQVLDPFVRAVRTGLQVVIGFVSLAPLVPLIVTAIGAEDGTQAGLVLAGVAAWVTAAAGIAARVMAIPGVNGLLSRIGIGGHSGVFVGGGDTQTRFVTLPSLASAGVTDPLH